MFLSKSCIDRDLPLLLPSLLSSCLSSVSENQIDMGNCQAIDAAALVIQHPNGKLERLYWPVTASEIMSLNPGHYVSLIIPLPLSDSQHPQDADQPIHQNTVRFTRVKLLRPTDTLALGHAYRLITSQGNNNNKSFQNNTLFSSLLFFSVIAYSSDSLLFGVAEVMKVLRAKKYAKIKRQQQQQQDSIDTSASDTQKLPTKEDNPQVFNFDILYSSSVDLYIIRLVLI